LKRAAILIALAACNQRDAREAAKEAPPPAPSPAPAPPVAKAPPAAPPDAPEVYHVEIELPDASPGDEARMEDEAKRYADLLTADGSNGPGGAIVDTRRRPGTDLQQQMDEVRTNGTVIASGTPPRGRITVANKMDLDDATLTSDIVLAKIMAVYMAGLHRCYRDVLHADPTKRGKLVVSFTVNETGRVSKLDAAGFDDQLDACVKTSAGGWRFAVPKDKDGEATEASFQLTFQLVPD
jgi:hypothetical protein